jgi:hypothetical protein
VATHYLCIACMSCCSRCRRRCRASSGGISQRYSTLVVEVNDDDDDGSHVWAGSDERLHYDDELACTIHVNAWLQLAATETASHRMTELASSSRCSVVCTFWTWCGGVHSLRLLLQYSRVCSMASLRRHRLAQRRAQQPIRIARTHCSPAPPRRMSSASASDHTFALMRHWPHGDDRTSHPLSPPAAPFLPVIARQLISTTMVNVGLISVCPSAADARLDAGAHD